MLAFAARSPRGAGATPPDNDPARQRPRPTVPQPDGDPANRIVILQILVLNVGSTTLKYAVVDTATERIGSQGTIDKIGQKDGEAPDHLTAARQTVEQQLDAGIDAIGHRVVQGGRIFTKATPVDAAALSQLSELDDLAPIHNPPARQVVEALVATGIGLPQAMVFDTAFYTTLPPAAHRYALPGELVRKYHLRRYGAHGTSHQYVTEAALRFLPTGQRPRRTISLHLGGGCSATAAVDGVAVETSMGFTPLEGLVMSTRSGNVDPSIVTYLIRHAGLSASEVERQLNHHSGLLGMCGDSDMRTILRRCDEGDQEARDAIDVYVHRLRQTIGGLVAVLGGCDALLFTAGVGEHAATIRRQVTEGLACFGIAIDDQANQAASGADCIHDISMTDVGTKTLVVPTNESLAIARQVADLFE